MTLQKKDFIEIEFTGKVKDGNVFDSNLKKDIEKAGLATKAEPFIFCLGEGMFLKGVDDFLIGKETGDYEIELKPEDAFGKRDSKLLQRIPMKIFNEQKINPFPGAVFNFDGRIAKVLAVSGGRVMVDFNNPIAGKEVVYNVKVIRKIEDLNEKINALNKFLFRKEFKFEVRDKKLILHVEKQMKQFVEMFKDKYKELFGLELEVEEVEEKAEIKKEAVNKSQ